MAKRLQRHGGHQEDDRQAGQQDVQRDLVGRLLPRRPLDQGDHPVDEALAGPGRDLDDDPVGQHLGAAGDRAAVATGLPDDRGRLAGDRGLVDAGDALDDVAVTGDDLARLDHHPVAELQRRSRRRASSVPSAQQPAGHRLGLGPAQRGRLGLAPALGHGLGEVGEDDGEPQPHDDRPGEQAGVDDREHRGQHRADLDDEHDRAVHHHAGVELADGGRQRGQQHPRVEQARLDPCRCVGLGGGHGGRSFG